jgi:hypothetical protein
MTPSADLRSSVVLLKRKVAVLTQSIPDAKVKALYVQYLEVLRSWLVLFDSIFGSTDPDVGAALPAKLTVDREELGALLAQSANVYAGLANMAVLEREAGVALNEDHLDELEEAAEPVIVTEDRTAEVVDRLEGGL